MSIFQVCSGGNHKLTVSLWCASHSLDLRKKLISPPTSISSHYLPIQIDFDTCSLTTTLRKVEGDFLQRWAQPMHVSHKHKNLRGWHAHDGFQSFVWFFYMREGTVAKLFEAPIFRMRKIGPHPSHIHCLGSCYIYFSLNLKLLQAEGVLYSFLFRIQYSTVGGLYPGFRLKTYLQENEF